MMKVKNLKDSYASPTVEILRLSQSDVIATSSTGSSSAFDSGGNIDDGGWT